MPAHGTATQSAARWCGARSRFHLVSTRWDRLQFQQSLLFRSLKDSSTTRGWFHVELLRNVRQVFSLCSVNTQSTYMVYHTIQFNTVGIFVYFLCVKNYGLNVYLGTITSINGELYCIFIENEKKNKNKNKRWSCISNNIQKLLWK